MYNQVNESPPGRVNGRLADRDGEAIGWKPPQYAAIERRSDRLLKKYALVKRKLDQHG